MAVGPYVDVGIDLLPPGGSKYVEKIPKAHTQVQLTICLIVSLEPRALAMPKAKDRRQPAAVVLECSSIVAIPSMIAASRTDSAESDAAGVNRDGSYSLASAGRRGSPDDGIANMGYFRVFTYRLSMPDFQNLL
jgi:hypothetical protein